MRISVFIVALLVLRPVLAQQIRSVVLLQNKEFKTSQLPRPLAVQPELGIIALPFVTGKVVHSARNSENGLYETRATITPNGDYLLMFPDGGHYGSAGRIGEKKVNDMLAYRSKDKGKTWQGPTVVFDIDYNQHGFIPFIPKDSKRIYAFGTQPIWGLYNREEGLSENAPIGYRYSDDDGVHWSEVKLIRPINDPTFKGMSVMRMTETDKGTWLLGSHEADWSYKPLLTRQYVLRSDNQGKTWELLPGKRHQGWFVRNFGRMDEGRPINLGNDKVFLMARTMAGTLFGAWSDNDGKTWTEPVPTSLVHPDAPPMLFHLSDGKTLIAFHHNQAKAQKDSEFSKGNFETQLRAEIWFATSTDGGHTWSEPRFVFANALAESFKNEWRNYNCSYLDMIQDNGVIHLFCPHRWERVLHLQFKEEDLYKFPTRANLGL